MLKYLLSLLLLLAPVQLLQAADPEIHCLASNVYYESKGEPYKGQLAVALVTLNRVDDPRFPDSICSVVYQKNQFSWTKTKNASSIRTNSEQWRTAKTAAMQAIMDRQIIGEFKATHFHNTSINPKWKLKKVAKIHNHIFYM